MELSDQAFASRVAVLLAEETSQPERWWYLSFADSGFRGAFVVKAQGATTALLAVNAPGENPGGEVLCWPIPDEEIPGEQFRNRRLTKEEVVKAWGEAKSLGEWEAESEGGN